MEVSQAVHPYPLAKYSFASRAHCCSRWGNGNKAQNGAQSHVEAPQVLEPTTKKHHRSRRTTTAKSTRRRTRGSSKGTKVVPHKAPYGKWCKDK